MALVKCQECGKDVSSEALECPHCGYSLKLPTPRRARKWPYWILAVLLGFIGLWILGYVGEQEKSSVQKRVPVIPEQVVEVASSEWTSLDEYGNAVHTLRLKNMGSHTVQDIEISIQYWSKTNSFLKVNDHTIYEFIPAGKTITVKVQDYAPKFAHGMRITVGSSQLSLNGIK